MKALIVHCHPEPTSFNAALTAVATQALRERGCEVEVSDLYAEEFDPREGPEHYRDRADADVFSALGEQRHACRSDAIPTDVRRQIDRLDATDLLIFQFPLWWHGPPAMLKGWFDRVFMNGGLYTSAMRYDRGYFVGRRALCSVTTGAPEASFGPGARGGDMDRMLWPIHYSLHYMGFSILPYFATFGVQGHGYAYGTASDQKSSLTQSLDMWRRRLLTVEQSAPIGFPGWADWDADGASLRGAAACGAHP